MIKGNSMDLDSITEESVKKMKTTELKEKLKELEEQYSIYDADQLAIKLSMNSMYGVYASKYFYFQSYGIAESITGIGRFITNKTKNIINKYFQEIWPNDTKLHKSMGLTNVKPIQDIVSVYCDTDSVYIALDEVYENVEGYRHADDEEYGGTKFALELHEKRLSKFLNKYFESLADNFNADNFLDLELEKISRSGTFLTKKKYALDVSWKSGMFFDKGTKLEVLGGEIVERATPKYLKDKLKEMVKWLLKQNVSKYNPNQSFDLAGAIEKISKIKDEFMLQDIDVIAKSQNVNLYNKYVISDNEKIELKKGAVWNVRCSAYYNWLLNNKYPHLKKKYPLIKDGDTIKYYHMKSDDPDFSVMAYLPNMFPYEMAPEIDRDEHFNHAFLIPFNRYMKAIGQNDIDISMTATMVLF